MFQLFENENSAATGNNKTIKYAPTILLNSNFPSIAYNSTAFAEGRSIDDELENELIEADLELEDLASTNDPEDEIIDSSVENGWEDES